MPKEIFSYSNGEVTVIWKPNICTHSGNCVRGLNTVFNNNVKPWININGAHTTEIIEQVKKCPSGALSFKMNIPDLDEKEKI